MKTSLIAFLFAAVTLCVSAADVKLPRPGLLHKTNTTIGQDGSITVKNAEGKSGGVVYHININQTEAAKIQVSGESKCDEGTKFKNPADYSLFCDFTYTDGTKKYGFIQAFNATNREWQKKDGVFTPAKPVKQIRLYVLFRNNTGAATFKNIAVKEIK